MNSSVIQAAVSAVSDIVPLLQANPIGGALFAVIVIAICLTVCVWKWKR